MIEAFRFISCIMVVFIHAPFYHSAGGYIGAFGCYAVPFFFMISGYYFKPNILYIKKKLFDTIRIIIIAGTICVTWNCINSYIDNNSFSIWFCEYANMKTLFKFLLFNRAVFFNSVFYYLFILVYIYTILIFTRNLLNLSNILLFVTPFIYFLGYYYVHFAGKAWYYSGNFLFTGFPMFCIGRLIRIVPQIFEKIRKHEFIIFLIGLLVTLFELKYLPVSGYTYVGQIIIAMALLCFCINNKQKKAPYLFVYAGSHYSLYIMLFHCEIRDTIGIFMSNKSLFFPIIVLMVSICFALIASTLLSLITKMT